MTIQQILTKYWGYHEFRPLQEEVINSVLQGKDTLALLPTGGGKSICFQVPAMAKEGICIVISPLIALMKDQVENLGKRGIKAVAVTSAMRKHEIDITLDNCAYGDVKFLYLSPERLSNELFLERVKKMKVNFIAVDESHCISQWGFDFRPAYLQIAQFREILPGVPVIALTATATVEVVKEIQEKLLFKNENVIQKSFERKNLAYVVLHEENKLGRLVKIANKINGTGIVYVRNRKKTQEIAEFLNRNNISADYYHAGLDHPARNLKQENWMMNKTRIIVSTNAFGMGIDKTDVRFVVHIDLPDCLEAYFQEAGRAGRDEKKAYAILLFNEADRLDLEHNVQMSFPSIEEIKQTYQAIANYYQLAIGSSQGAIFDFDITDLCSRYQLNALTVFNCLKFLEKEAYIAITEAFYQPSRVHFRLNKEDIYKFQVANKAYDNFIKLLLRSYAGAFENYIKINENDLAKRAGITFAQVINILNALEKFQVLSYLPQTTLPQIIFTRERTDVKHLKISKEHLSQRKEKAVERMEWVINYTTSTHKCRSQMLLSYFGENDCYRCGICDVCLERNKLDLSSFEFEQVSDKIKTIIKEQPLNLTDLVNSIKDSREDKTLKVVQWLIDNEKLAYDEGNKLVWRK